MPDEEAIFSNVYILIRKVECRFLGNIYGYSLANFL